MERFQNGFCAELSSTCLEMFMYDLDHHMRHFSTALNLTILLAFVFVHAVPLITLPLSRLGGELLWMGIRSPPELHPLRSDHLAAGAA